MAPLGTAVVLVSTTNCVCSKRLCVVFNTPLASVPVTHTDVGFIVDVVDVLEELDVVAAETIPKVATSQAMKWKKSMISMRSRRRPPQCWK